MAENPQEYEDLSKGSKMVGLLQRALSTHWSPVVRKPQRPGRIFWPQGCSLDILHLRTRTKGTDTSFLAIMHVCMLSRFSRVSLRPYGLKPTRLLSPWNSPGKNTGVGCHALLEGVFSTQDINVVSRTKQVLVNCSVMLVVVVISYTSNLCFLFFRFITGKLPSNQRLYFQPSPYPCSWVWFCDNFSSLKCGQKWCVLLSGPHFKEAGVFLMLSFVIGYRRLWGLEWQDQKTQEAV